MKNKWNERYLDETFFYGQEANDFLKEISGSLKEGSKILCLAEGEGRNATYLAQLGHTVTAVDMSEVGLEKLKTLAAIKEVEVETIVADLSDFNLGIDKWDAIVSIWCHLPSRLREKIHSDCLRALKHDGLFILEAYTPEQLKFKTGGPDNLDMLMTKATLQNELSGLVFSIIEEKNREIHEGIGHNGQSAVVQVLGIKK